jgi:hypothetical protein
MEVKIVKSNRGEDILEYNNHTFYFAYKTKTTNIIRWRCTQRKYSAKSETIYLDGTFDYRPKLFTQLFTLHGYFNNNYVPFVFALLPNKTKQNVYVFLNILVLECQNVGLILKPKTVICNFEESIHIALKEIWNNVNIFGCHFHLTQSWYRKVQNLGLCKA